jgi:lactoylglutathione lyase
MYDSTLSRFSNTSGSFSAILSPGVFPWKPLQFPAGTGEKQKELCMKLSYLVLLSDDVPAAIRFWRDVMELPLIYSDEAVGYAAFETGSAGIVLSLYSRSGLATLLGEAIPMPTGHQMYLSFPVDDVDVAFAKRIERGATPVASPRDVPMQQSRLAHFNSPDGHLIEIFSPIPKTVASLA